MKNLLDKIKKVLISGCARPGDRQWRGQKGFTLVEVLLALAIVAITVTALGGVLAMSSKILNLANSDETARDYAQAQMENIQKQDYIPINDNTTHNNLYSALSGPASGGYTLSSTATPVDEGNGTSTDTGMQKITVTVNQGSDILFTLTSYKAKY